MRRQAKAPSAGPISAGGSGLGSISRAFARRGACGAGLIVLVLLASASSAQASFNVHHLWGNPSSAGSTVGGQFSTTPEDIAVNDASGDVYVVDRGNNRIEQFTASGSFIRAWGRDVIIAGKPNDNGTGFEICDTTAPTPNVAADCKAGIVDVAAGGTLNAPRGISVNQTTGDVYVSEGGNLRVQQFTSAGGFVRTWGAGVATGGATGTGTVTNGSGVIASVKTTSKAFVVGQVISGNGIVPGTRITSVAATSITMSQAAGPAATGAGTAISVAAAAGNVARNETQTVTLYPETIGGTFTLTFTTPNPSSTTATTAAIPWDASPGAVETALAGLANIGAGNVAVSSGNPGGGKVGGPYVVEFKGTRFADTDVAQLTSTTTGLTYAVIAPNGDKTVTIATTRAGASAPETCTTAADCKAGVTSTEGGGFQSTFAGYLAVAPAGAPNAGNVVVADGGNVRVAEFTATGAFVRAFGFGVTRLGPGSSNSTASEVQRLTVAASGGTFVLGFDAQTTAPLPYDATAGQVEAALNNLPNIGGEGGSVAVSGGPGNATGSAPYVVTFGGALTGTNVAQIDLDTTHLALAAGAKLTCAERPLFSPEPTPIRIDFQWLRNGVPIGGATDSNYFTSAADAGKVIQCQAFYIGENAASTYVVNRPTLIAPPSAAYPPGAPEFIEAPAQTGNLEGTVDRELTCNAGAWTGAPTSYTYQWFRNGEAFGAPSAPTAATSSKITVTAAQQTPAAVFQCMVAATNAGGTVAKVSQNRATTPAPNPAAPSPRGDIARTAPNTVIVPSAVATVTEGVSGFEVCTAADSDVCKAGEAGAQAGQFGSTAAGGTLPVARVEVDGSGAIYTAEAAATSAEGEGQQRRVQKFTPQSGSPSVAAEIFAPEIAAARVFSTTSGPEELSKGPLNVAVDPATGHVYVVMASPNVRVEGVIPVGHPERRILEYSSSGELLRTHLAKAGISSLLGLAVKSGGGALYFDPRAGTPRIFAMQEFTAPVLSFEADEVGNHEATLKGTVRPGATTLNTRYQFEYSPNGEDWTSAPAAEVDLGNGSGGPLDPGSCPVGNPEVCNVSVVLTDLRANATYFARLVAHTEFGTPTVAEKTFDTSAGVPVVKTGGGRWSSPVETGPTLLLLGEVNPSGDRTTYVFQYVSEEDFEASGFARPSVAPVPPTPPVEAGRGFETVVTRQSVSGLDPTKTYVYRLVASNSAGAVAGAERTIAPPKATDRFLEWVSAADSYNLGPEQLRGVTAGGARAYFTAESFGNPTSLPALYSGQITERTSTGWVSRDVSPDPNYSFSSELFQGFTPSADMSKMLWERMSSSEWRRGLQGFSLVHADGGPDPYRITIEPFEPEAASPDGPSNTKLFGTSADLSHAVFQEALKPIVANRYLRVFSNEPKVTEGRSNLVELVGAGTPGRFIRLVNQTSGGEQLGGRCGAGLGDEPGGLGGVTTNAISEEGSVIYFNAKPVPAAELEKSCQSVSKFKDRIYKRIDGATTLEVSKSQCSRVANLPAVPACQTTAPAGTAVPDGDDSFEGASADGSTVFLSSARQLTDSDLDATPDLYVYDASPPTGQPQLVQVSAGEAIAGDHPTVGFGGKFVATLASSQDGSRIYFIAEGRLTPEATAGARNLYVYERDAAHESGRIAFITTVGAGELFSSVNGVGNSYTFPLGGPGGADHGDGHVLLFNTAQPLLAGDDDTAVDIYRYDDTAVAAKLACVSCAGDSSRETRLPFHDTAPMGSSVPASREASEDGSVVVFDTSDTLLGADENPELVPPDQDCTYISERRTGCDVYAWHEGQLELISGATEEYGAVDPFISADGKAIFFKTGATLTMSDLNSAQDLYSARTGGGFPDEPGPGVSCQASEECHKPPTPVPAPAQPASVTHSGPGNPPAAPPKCRKGKVRRHGRCVSKPHKKGREHHAKRAGHKRGGAR